MTSVGESLHAAALVLEADIRMIDAGETKATPDQRAFLVGAVRGLKLPGGTESGGLPVGEAGESCTGRPAVPAGKALDGGRPENFDLADLQDPSFDGGRPASSRGYVTAATGTAGTSIWKISILPISLSRATSHVPPIHAEQC